MTDTSRQTGHKLVQRKNKKSKKLKRNAGKWVHSRGQTNSTQVKPVRTDQKDQTFEDSLQLDIFTNVYKAKMSELHYTDLTFVTRQQGPITNRKSEIYSFMFEGFVMLRDG